VYITTGNDSSQLILARADPRTLDPVGKSLALISPEFPGPLSPNGSRIVLVGSTRLRFIALPTMQDLGSMPIPGWANLAATWLDERQLAVVTAHSEGVTVAFIDVPRRRLLHTFTLGRALWPAQMRGTPDGIAILMRRAGIGPARVVILSGNRKRVLTIKAIQAGSEFGRPDLQRELSPALTTDRDRSRAFVIGGGTEPLAQIDIRTGKLSYRRLSRTLGPPPQRSAISLRDAIQLSENRILVTGEDSPSLGTHSMPPLGAALIDTRTGRVGAFDPYAHKVWRAGDTVVTRGDRPPLRAFTLAGRPRFQLGRSPASPNPTTSGASGAYVCTNGRYLYFDDVENQGGWHPRLTIVDTKNGKRIAYGKRVGFRPPADLSAILSTAQDADSGHPCLGLR
jgi:hypothetical protein